VICCEPLDKEWEVARISNTFDTDLFPLKVSAVRASAVTFDCFATELGFYWLNVVGTKNPRKPFTTFLSLY
jgi:hypothetical protein